MRPAPLSAILRPRTDDKVVAVMVVSEKPHTDKTVTLNVGDHPFFQHTSNIDYGTAKLFPRAKLENQINARGKLARRLSRAARKARAGILGSSRTPNYIKEYFEARFDTTGQAIPAKPSRQAP